MSTQEHPDVTPQSVAKHATENVRLPRLALLGVFGTSQEPGALVRTKSGRIARVTKGDKVAGGTVLAIGADQLVLERRGTTRVLALPAA